MLDKQNILADWKMDLIESTFYNYQTLCISFGFVSLFAIAFPLTPLIYWLVTAADTMATKSLLLNVSKRPTPIGGQDIGQWHHFLKFTAIVSIFSNVGIFVYSTNSLYNISQYTKLVIYFVSCFGFLFIFLVIDCTLDVGDTKVEELILRQDYLAKKMNKFVTNRDEETNSQR